MSNIGKIVLAVFFALAAKTSAEEQHGLNVVIFPRSYDGPRTNIENFAGRKPIIEQVMPALDCVWGMGDFYQNRPITDIWPSIKQSSFLSIRWIGKLTAPRSGTWTLRFSTDQNDRLMVGGHVLVDRMAFGRTGMYRDVNVEMVAGRGQEIVVEFSNWSNGCIHLLWKGPGDSDFTVVPESAFTLCAPEPTNKQVAAPKVTVRSGFAAGRSYAEVAVPPGTYAHYTLDGTEPTRLLGNLYTVPVAITENTTFQVRTIHPDGGQSEVVSKNFTVAKGPMQKGLSILRTGNSLTNNVLMYYPATEAAGGYDVYSDAGIAHKNILGAHVGGAGVGTKWLWENEIENPAKPKGKAKQSITDRAPYDCVITQPFWPSGNMNIEEEADYTSRFYELALASSPQADLWLYPQWLFWEIPRDLPKTTRHTTESAWLSGMENYIASFEKLRTVLQAKYPGKKIRVLPVVQAVLALKNEIQAGTVPGLTAFETDIMSDGIHFSRAGSYFLSLVFYATLHGKSPLGLVVNNTGLSIEQQKRFQEIAWETMKNCKWAGITK